MKETCWTYYFNKEAALPKVWPKIYVGGNFQTCRKMESDEESCSEFEEPAQILYDIVPYKEWEQEPEVRNKTWLYILHKILFFPGFKIAPPPSPPVLTLWLETLMGATLYYIILAEYGRCFK